VCGDRYGIEARDRASGTEQDQHIAGEPAVVLDHDSLRIGRAEKAPERAPGDVVGGKGPTFELKQCVKVAGFPATDVQIQGWVMGKGAPHGRKYEFPAGKSQETSVAIPKRH
jgi:hypothetical protein